MKRPIPFLAGLMGALAASGLASVIEAEFTWPRGKTLRLCWAPRPHWDPQESVLEKLFDEETFTPFTREEREAVESIILQEFSPKRTGIAFEFTGTCQLGLVEQIPIYTTSSATKKDTTYFGFAGEIGRTPDPTWITHASNWAAHQEDYWLPVALGHFPSRPYLELMVRRHLTENDPMPALRHLQMIALHEAGHLAGLYHEHVRPEHQGDPNCWSLKKLKESPEKTARFVGAYDPNSIMNYCWKNALETYGTDFYFKDPQGRDYGNDPFAASDRKELYDASKINLVDNSLLKAYLPFRGYFPVRVRIGLSQGDVKALRALYVDPPAGGKSRR